MLRTLYAGNIPWSCDDDALHSALAPAVTAVGGAVNAARVALSREDGRSRGFGFVEVEVPSEDAFTDLLNSLQGFVVGGRTLIISEARPRAPRL